MNAIDPNDAALAQRFVQLAQGAISMNSADRERAEREIKEFQDRVDQQSGFVLLLLNIAAASGPAASFASIVFKNTVKLCWNSATAEHCIMENDKAIVRDTIIEAMLRAAPNVRRNLAETINLIAELDFPKAWPNALDRIVQVLVMEKDLTLQCAALSTAHSVLGRYRDQKDLDEVFVKDLRIIYTALTSPLLSSMELLLNTMEKGGAEARVASQGLTSAVECLCDITSFDLGDEFIWSIEKFVNVLMRCIQYNNSASDGACFIELKSAALACVTHFLLRFDEDFENHTGGFLKVVWDTIASPESCAKEMDDVVIQGLNLLSAACRGTMSEVFNNVDVLKNLVEQVILPNLALQPADVELYSTEADSYIQRDIEGSDYHTRRREAGELVRSLIMYFPAISVPLFAAQLQQLMTEASAGDWKAKDLCIYLVSALALQGQYANSQRGATQRLSDVVPFDTFLKQYILPELSSDVSAQSPFIIKADCIRFVATFRTHIELQLLLEIVGLLTTWILCPDEVVCAYAAHAVERIFTIKRFGEEKHVINDANLGDKAAPLLQNLCLRLQQDERPSAYTMQCLLRVCQNCRSSVAPFIGDIITCISPVLKESAKNPSNPLFSYCMFEVISTCIMIRPEDGPAIESVLWEHLIFILQNDVPEYMPYTLQLMAQLLYTHDSGCSEPPVHYRGLLEPLLVPDIYQQRSNIPAAARLLVAFVERYPRYVHGVGLTEKTITLFRSLLQYKNYDHEGLNILTAVIMAYPQDIISSFMDSVYRSLLQRLQSSKTPKYVRILIIFLSIVVVLHGAKDFVTKIGFIQDGLFQMLLERVWLPNVQKVTGTLERKVCAVALACLFGESAELQMDVDMWLRSVLSCFKLIQGVVESDDVTSFTPKPQSVDKLTQSAGEVGFRNSFCLLLGAARAPVDVCHFVKQLDVYFKERIQQALRGPNGARLASALQSNRELGAVVL